MYCILKACLLPIHHRATRTDRALTEFHIHGPEGFLPWARRVLAPGPIPWSPCTRPEGRTCTGRNELAAMRLTQETFQMLGHQSARRFAMIFPDGLEWDCHGLERLLQAGMGAGLHHLVKAFGQPLPCLHKAYLAEVNLQGSIIPSTDLSQANLSEANLEDVNLSRSDLSGANLHEAVMLWTNLRGANVQQANLSEALWNHALLDLANLSQANLEKASMLRAVAAGANLSQANLREVDLSWSNLVWADLHQADLSLANLRGANLHGANLSGANLSGANLADTIMTDVQLEGAILPEEWEEKVWER